MAGDTTIGATSAHDPVAGKAPLISFVEPLHP
jgi:hypothetical protein